MGKDPAFLFYPNDYLGGTMGMTLEQKGCYMELLMMQFNHGKFTEAQAKQVLSICFDVAWATVKQKFETDGTYYWNNRLAEEINKRRKFTESRRLNALSPKTNKASAEHMHDHMENENENENIVEDKTTRLKKREVKFRDEVMQFDYPTEMLSSFFLYWSEPNKSGTKMRFELQQTWDLKRRLLTWANRDTKTNDKPKAIAGA